MPGPPPTPTALKIARGSRRVTNDQEPQPAKQLPDCPAHLSDAARAEWVRVSKMLAAADVLTAIDGDALALYCAAYARWADAETHIAEDGVIVKSPNGYPIQNPYLAVANHAMEQMHKYLAKFGMNPADRTRVRTATPAQPKSKLDAFKLRSA